MPRRPLKHAAYCGTRNIYGDMETAAKSLVAMSDVDRVHLVIEDEDIGHALPEIIQCHDVSGQTYFPVGGANMGSAYTYMAMMRIALCHVLPRAHKVLSLDTDTICMKDVSAIWDLPTDGCYLSATHEWHRTGNGLLYCNFGVVLYDLDMLRDGKADECIDVLNRRKYTWVEQDVCNYLCQGRIHDMPATYNSNWWTDKNAADPHILHFAGVAHDAWANRPEVTRWRDMPWDEVMRMHDERTKSSR